MDHRHFDALTKLLAWPTDRRAVFKALAGVVGGTLLSGHFSSPVEAAGASTPTPASGPKSCANQPYTKGKHFSGKPINADSTFFPSLDQIDTCAGGAGVTIDVTNSYRPPGTVLTGTIVKKAEESNHDAGHAIDMNVMYTDDKKKQQRCDSSCLAGVDLPKPVKDFIDCVKKAGLRWGQDYATKKDPVHIDDGLNLKNPKRWQDRKDAMNNAKTCAACEPCNLSDGVCTSNCGAGKGCDDASGTCKDKSACGSNVVMNANGAGFCR
jgi:hypothetical protein